MITHTINSEADTQSFQFYKSGVFNDPSCGNNLDHGVAAVGYGATDDGDEYFKVRNSWVSFTIFFIFFSYLKF
jgi:C1A family cysteine protease